MQPKIKFELNLASFFTRIGPTNMAPHGDNLTRLKSNFTIPGSPFAALSSIVSTTSSEVSEEAIGQVSAISEAF